MDMQLGPDLKHPEIESAVGSRNSAFRESRDEYKEHALLVNEEVDKILNHISSKLPPEVLGKIDIMSNVKEKLHNYYNISYQNMYNRYLTTVEDELSKKYRDLVTKEENKTLNKYSPRLISDLLVNIGGIDKFNTAEIEKSVVNIFGHLQGAIQREAYNLETNTNAILRQKIDIGAFVRGENTYAIAKCSIKNNRDKPKTVSDLKLAINILSSELISPILHVHDNSATLLRSIASEEIIKYLEEKIEKFNEDLLDSGKNELSEGEAILKKIAYLDDYIDTDEQGANSRKLELISQHILDVVSAIPKSVADIDPISLRAGIDKILENDGIRNRGYNSIVNHLTSVLDSSKMGYQHIENHKNFRMCKIKEYNDDNIKNLPDERYSVLLNYYDREQIISMRKDYKRRFKQFQESFNEAILLLEKKYLSYKKETNMIDYSDVLEQIRQEDEESIAPKKTFLQQFLKNEAPKEESIKKRIRTVDNENNAIGKTWNEFRFKPDEKKNISQYEKFETEVQEIKEKLIYLEERIKEVYDKNFPDERILIEERIDSLSEKFNVFNGKVNPFQLQPGVCLEIDITSVKRKKTTIMSIANVLNEFLHYTSKGFSDTAFAGFQRRRSTIKDPSENF